jgi:hypothetical protein
MWRLASSPISDLKRLWVRDVFQTDRDCRWFLFGGLTTRWFDFFGSGSYASRRGGPCVFKMEKAQDGLGSLAIDWGTRPLPRSMILNVSLPTGPDLRSERPMPDRHKPRFVFGGTTYAILIIPGG